jgi:hypothetical protein
MQGAAQSDRTIAPSPFNEVGDSDVVLTSSDNVVFYCHKLLLALVSPFFKTMFSLPVDQSQDVYDGRPCVALAEDSESLRLLLSWCDPRSTRPRTLAELEKVLELADKYGMEYIMKQVENFMIGIETTNPVELFAISTRFRLEELARAAAKNALDEPLDALISMSRVPAVRHLSGYSLRNLFQYHMNCRREASCAATNLVWLERHRYTTVVLPFTRVDCDDDDCPIIVERRDNSCHWVNWWLDYMELAATAFNSRPSASAITSSEFLDKVIGKISAISCDDCRKGGQDAFFTFNDFLAKEVRRRIDEVNLSHYSNDRG